MAERLVGRAAEHEGIRALLDQVRAGYGRTLFVEGEAGIGKTRLLEYAIEHAQRTGFTIRTGRADALDRSRPFGTIATALEADGGPDDPAMQDLIEALRPSLEMTRSVPQPVDLGFHVTDRVVAALERIAARGPVLLAIDDLQWADPASIAAVGAVVSRQPELPCALVATVRPSPRGPALNDLLASAPRSRAGLMMLSPLGHEDVLELATEVAGAHPGPILERELEGAGGNPLFVIELIAALRDENELELVGGHAETRSASLPPTLRLTILRRLSLLPDATLEVLQAAAILGTTFSVRELALLTRRSATELLAVLREAFRTRVLGESGDRLGFRHPLIREAIYDDLPVSLRHALHQEIGRALAEADAPPEDVAHHLALGATPGDDDAVVWLRRAARAAAPRSAATAVDLLQRALDLASPAYSKRASLIADLVPMLVLLGRDAEAETLTGKVAALAVDPQVELRLRAGLAAALTRRGKRRAALTEVRAAARRLPPDLRWIAIGSSGLLNLTLGDVSAAAADAERALTAAEGAGHDAVATAALMTLTWARAAIGDLDGALAFGERSLALAERAGALFSGFLIPHLTYGGALVQSDRLDEADRVFRAGIQRADELGTSMWLPNYQSGLVINEFYRGNWDDALSEAETNLQLGRDTGTRWGLYAAAVTARIALARDDLPLAESALDRADDEMRENDTVMSRDWVMWAKALLLEERGDTAAAWFLIERALTTASELVHLFGNHLYAIDAARLALAGGDRDRSVEIATELDEVAARAGVATSSAAALRCRALVHGDLDAAVEAAAAYRRGPRPYDRALACHDAAVALAADGRLDDARSLFEDALALYAALGATGDSRRTVAAMRRSGIRRKGAARTQRPTVGWGSLTPTEGKVASLIAEGLSNPQIADRLFISRHTVETHVKHIFAKLNMSSRVELAADVVRRRASPPIELG